MRVLKDDIYQSILLVARKEFISKGFKEASMRTIANTDKIVVLDNGSVAEMGNPEELKRQQGIFSRMVNRQTGNN